MRRRAMATDRLSDTFTALADPTRRAILARLARGEATVTELAAPFALSLPAVSKHLRVLRRAGLVAQGRRAQWRPCCERPPTGWSTTGSSGRGASTAWTTTCASCNDRKGRGRSMAEGYEPRP